MDYYAYYYMLFTPQDWSSPSMLDRPLIGDYASDDLEVIRTQVKQAKSVGLKGFIMCWSDRAVTPDRNKIMDMMTDVAEAEDFKLGVLVEFKGLSLAERDRQLQMLVNRWADRNPFHVIDEKMLIIHWASWEYTGAQFEAILAKVRDKTVNLSCENSWGGAFAGLDGTIDKMPYFDGNAPYTHWEGREVIERERFPTFKKMGQILHENGKLFMCPICPGYNKPSDPLKITDRENGEYYRLTQRLALECGTDIIGIVSWNEFWENTHIEPSENYGHQYLELTKTFTPIPPIDLPTIGGIALAIINVALVGYYIYTKVVG